jgi:hypothetical protein
MAAARLCDDPFGNAIGQAGVWLLMISIIVTIILMILPEPYDVFNSFELVTAAGIWEGVIMLAYAQKKRNKEDELFNRLKGIKYTSSYTGPR